MQRKLHIMTVIVGIWFTIQPYAVFAVPFAYSEEKPSIPDTTIAKRYPYLHFVEKDFDVSKDSSDLSDDVFYDRAARIAFPVNKFNLPDDSPLLEELTNDVIPELNRDSMRLHGILLRGAASPEGPFQHNARLSKKRAKSLVDFLRERLTFSIDKRLLAHQSGIEDYGTLLLLMRRANDADYETVERLVNRHVPRREYTLLKRKLRAIQGGKLWKRLNNDYFPQLRTARFILLIEKQQAEQPTEPAPPQFIVPTDKVAMVVDDTPSEIIPERIPRREFLSIKTNLLFYGVWMPNYNRWCPIPNVGIEYYPKRGHFTFGASLDFPWWRHWSQHKFFQIRNYQLETRYYLKDSSHKPHKSNEAHETHESNKSHQGAAFRGFYLLGYVHAGLFEIGFDKDTGWKGEGVGAGIGAGYMLPISKNGHWRLDFGLQVGWMTCRYDPYQYENLVNLNYHDGLYYYRWTGKASDFKKRQYRFNWLGPTRVGITLTYDLLYRRQSKKGVSFKAYEPYNDYRANETHRANKANKPNNPNNQERRATP